MGMKNGMGPLSGSQANLLRMAAMQRGAFSQQQALIRGVTKKDLDRLERLGIIESIWPGYYSLTEEGKELYS